MYFDVLRFEMYRYVKSVAIVVIYRYRYEGCTTSKVYSTSYQSVS